MKPWIQIGATAAVALLAVASSGQPASREVLAPPSAEFPFPPGGGLAELPRESNQPVVLTNAGFEQALQGWSPGKPEAFSVVAAPGSAHSGQGCVRFDAAQKTSFVPSLGQTLREVGPGAYLLRFWVKTSGLGAQGKPAEGVRVSLEFQRENGGRAWPSTPVFRGTSDWQQKELQVFIPNDLKPGSVTLKIGRYGGPSGGEAWFDDFTIERQVPPAIEAFLLYPNYRGYLPEDGPQKVRVWIKKNAPQSPNPGRVEVKSGTNAIASVQLEARQEQVLEIDASKWSLGSYQLQASLGDTVYPAYHLHKISTAQRRSMAMWFDQNGVLYRNGKPEFVLGFYNAQGHDSVERLDQLAQARPNYTIDYVNWALPLAEQRQYLARLQERGMGYFSTVNMVYPGNPYNVFAHPIGKDLLPDVPANQDTQANLDRYLARLAQELRRTPGHAGWYVMDERSFSDVPRAFRQYQLLRQVDPDHPTYVVSDKPEEVFFWRDTADVLGLDPYPLFNLKEGRPLSMAGDWTRAVLDATQQSRPVWMVLQYFQGWSTDRWPTQEELRSMSLMAITEGARGIFYWSFGVRGLKAVNNKQQQAEYWRRALAVCQELHQLEPALVAADAADHVQAVSNPQIRWRARLADGKLFVFAYRPAKRHNDRFEQPAVPVTFTFRDGRTITRQFAPDTADWFSLRVNE